MAISQEDIQQVLNAIKAESQDVQELETVDSLNGVNSLPGVKGDELVNVPMMLLQKPATEAAAGQRGRSGRQHGDPERQCSGQYGHGSQECGQHGGDRGHRGCGRGQRGGRPI